MSTNSKERLRQLLAQHKTSQNTSAEPSAVALSNVVSESAIDPVESVFEPVVEPVSEPVVEPVSEPEFISELIVESVSGPAVASIATSVDSVSEPVSEPVSESVVEPIDSESNDLSETKVLSTDDIKAKLVNLSHLAKQLEGANVPSEAGDTVSDSDFVVSDDESDTVDVSSVETVDVPEETLSRSEDIVSARDEFVEGMVEGLPDFKSNAKSEATSSEVEDTLTKEAKIGRAHV